MDNDFRTNKSVQICMVKMRGVALVVLGLLASVSAFVEIGKNYHDSVGIPLAEKIRAYEESVMNSRQLYDDRIVGGAIAPTNAHPYLAGLLISFVNAVGSGACGASILSSNRLVTAAHCWFDGVRQASQYEVVLGSSSLFFGGTRVHTSTVFMHSQWNPTFLWNDIAMIYLPTNIAFTAAISPIALPSGEDLFDTFAGHWSIAAGYGKTDDAQAGINSNSVVSHVNLQVITVAVCQQTFGTVYVQASNICTSGTGGVGICNGDSGGPLVVTRNGIPTLVGISSFVASIGCQLGHPSVFARATSFYNFILQHM